MTPLYAIVLGIVISPEYFLLSQYVTSTSSPFLVILYVNPLYSKQVFISGVISPPSVSTSMIFVNSFQ